MRTTLDIDKPVLARPKEMQRKKKQTLSRIASSLLAEALSRHETASSRQKPPSLAWACARLDAQVDIADKDALHRALDAP